LSSSTTQTIACPSCGRQQSFVLWQSINVTLDPGLKEKLKSGELTTFQCNHCERRAEVVFSLLYHDMDKRWMFWLVPEGKLPPGLSSGLPKEHLPGYLLRLVRSRNELVEKLNVLDAGMDDRVVAAIKLLLRARLERDHGIENPVLLFDERVARPGGQSELHFAWVGEAKAQGIAVSTELYETLAAELKVALQGALGHKDAWLRTDQHYAAKLLAQRK